MKNKHVIRFVNGLVFLPVMSMSLSVGGVTNNNIYAGVPQNVLIQKLNMNGETAEELALRQAAELKASTEKAEADAIDTYYDSHDMPLLGMGMKMVLEAEKNDLDWRLLPAITVRESTGGKHDCSYAKFNSFGWGSCKIGFKSNEEAIETVARNLGGNNPNTAYHYADKNVKQLLQAYNPPSVVPHYADQVMKIMNDIGPEDMTTTVTANS